MNTQEFSNSFDTLLNSYSKQLLQGGEETDIILDEYEKSLFLTKAQQEVIIELYKGTSPYLDSFENTEEVRRYLDTLVKTKIFANSERVDGINISKNSFFYSLPSDLAFITFEQITLDDDSLKCYNGNIIKVYPVTQDVYNTIKDNPFRGPTKYKAIRLDYGDRKVEIVSKYNFKDYFIKYISKLKPIILIDLPEDVSIEGLNTKTECEINSLLHNTILDRAVMMALMSKGIKK